MKVLYSGLLGGELNLGICSELSVGGRGSGAVGSAAIFYTLGYVVSFAWLGAQVASGGV
jgi:hypothetical protein